VKKLSAGWWIILVPYNLQGGFERPDHEAEIFTDSHLKSIIDFTKFE